MSVILRRDGEILSHYKKSKKFDFYLRWRCTLVMGTTIFTCRTVWSLETNECGCVPRDVRSAQDLAWGGIFCR